MKQASRKTYYLTHSWIGVLSGILLFVVSFSGIPAMFAKELAFWQSVELRGLPAAETVSWQPLMDAAKDQGFDYPGFIIVPNREGGYASLAHFGGEETEPDRLYLRLDTLQAVDPGASDVVHLLEHLHTDLHLPSPFGRYLVGLAGMAMLLSIIAGVVIHTKWYKEFKQLRVRRSWRLLLSDHHKLLGLWVLPFAAILAFTGTILGLLGIISPILALAKFDGDVAAATAAVIGPQAEVVGESAVMMSLDDLYAIALTQQPDLDPMFALIGGVGDQGAVAKFSGGEVGKLSNLQSVSLSMVDGSVVHQANAVKSGPFYRTFAAVTPLHYVLFGDVWLKWFYALCTLGLSAVIVSGNLIWLDKRQRRGTHWLGGLTLGACSGLLVAMVAALSISPWLLGHAHQAMMEETVFWSVWGAAIMAGVLLPARTRRQQLIGQSSITAALLVLAVVGDGVMNQSWFWSIQHPIVAGTQWTFLILAVCLLWITRRLSSAVTGDQHRVEVGSPDPSGTETPA